MPNVPGENQRPQSRPAHCRPDRQRQFEPPLQSRTGGIPDQEPAGIQIPAPRRPRGQRLRRSESDVFLRGNGKLLEFKTS